MPHGLALSTWAQTLYGTVVNEAGKPLVGAHCMAGDVATITGPKGQFELEVSGAQARLLVTHVGYLMQNAR